MSEHSLRPARPPLTSGGVVRPIKVLLAEDNLVNQRVAVGLLQKRGHIVTVANNGQETLDFLARELFDLVLMDVQMPVMGGLEATAAIRAREREGAQAGADCRDDGPCDERRTASDAWRPAWTAM
jgi:CheY-like chemotaxis protein